MGKNMNFMINHKKLLTSINTALLSIICILFILNESALADSRDKQSRGVGIVSLDKPVLQDKSIRIEKTQVSDDSIVLIFSYPVGKSHHETLLNDLPVEVDLKIEGAWYWKKQSELVFQAENSLPENTQLTVKLNAEYLTLDGYLLAEDSRSVTVKTNEFIVEKLAIEDPVSNGNAGVIISGEIHFNTEVSHDSLRNNIQLLDEVDDRLDSIPLNVTPTTPSKKFKFYSTAVGLKKRNRDLLFHISNNLMPLKGNIQLNEEKIRRIPLKTDLLLFTEHASHNMHHEYGEVIISWSKDIVTDSAKGLIRVSPKINFSLDGEGNQLKVNADFQPNTKYTIFVGKGVKAKDGTVLEKSTEYDAQFKDRPELLGFRSQGVFLAKSGTQSLAIKSLNVSDVEIKIDRIFKNNVFWMFRKFPLTMLKESTYREEFDPVLSERIVEKTIKISGKKNKIINTSISLKDYIPAKKPGVYRVLINKSGSDSFIQRIVFITNIGLVAKIADKTMLVWATNYNNLKPIGGVKVNLVSHKNQQLKFCITNSKGFCKIKRKKNSKTEDGLTLLSAEKMGDFTFLDFQRFKVDTTGFDVDGKDIGTKSYKAFFYSERSIVKPGEWLNGLGIVRDVNNEPLTNVPVTIRIKKPNGNLESSFVQNTKDEGTVEINKLIPKYLPTGTYKLEFLIGDDVVYSSGFLVEEFIPDRMKVAIEANNVIFENNKYIDYTVNSHYFYGDPAVGLSVNTAVELSTFKFEPKGYEKYVFENPSRSLIGLPPYSEHDKLLDNEGQLKVRYKLPAFVQPPSGLLAMIQATVSEPGGRSVSSRLPVKLHAYSHYIGLEKPSKTFFANNESIEIQYVGVDTKGNSVRTGDLRVELFKEKWFTTLRQVNDKNYQYQSENAPEILKSFILPGGNKKGIFQFSDLKTGEYRVVTTDISSGASSSVSFKIKGDGFFPWPIESAGRLTLTPDKSEYKIGDTAQIQVQAPFS